MSRASGGSASQCVCTQLKMAARVVGRAYDVELAPEGLNDVQYTILAHVARHQPIAQMKLAGLLEMERTTLYRALEILGRAGLVKVRSAGAGVAKEVTLTARGTKVHAAAEKRWAAVHRRFVEAFDEDQAHRLFADLAKLRDVFRIEGGGAP